MNPPPPDLLKGTSRLLRLRLLFLLPLAISFLSLCPRGTAQNVIAWGDNTYGQINVPPDATNVIAAAAGQSHSLALRADGSVIIWGSKNGFSAITNVPASVTNVISIAAGYNHSLALRGDGSVVVWGDNTFGQTNLPSNLTNVIAIAAGDYHSLALLANGTVVAWGTSNSGVTNVPAGLTNVITIAASSLHSLALKKDGSVVTWGGNATKGALPDPLINVAVMSAGGTYNLYLDTSGRLLQSGAGPLSGFASSASPPKAATNLAAFSAGTNFSLALRNDGQLLVWGGTSATNLPPAATNVIALAAGYAHGLAVIGDGSVQLLGSPAFLTTASVGNYLPLYARAVGAAPLTYQWLTNGTPVPGTTNAAPFLPAVLGNDAVAYQVVVTNALNSVTSSIVNIAVSSLNAWGENLDGQCRIPQSVTNPVAVAAGAFHGLALQANATVVAWGKNFDGQTNVPPQATNALAVAAGGAHSLALRADGSVIAWGKNDDGQTNVPSAASNVVAVAAGWAHSVALREDGTVLAWGNNDYGQSSVSFLASQVISIAAGYYHTLALRADGRVISWGSSTNTPDSATNIIAIAAGWRHSLALRPDGTVLAWGDNTYGQTTVPPSATNILAIAAGWYNSFALRADGTVITWGKGLLSLVNTTNQTGSLLGIVLTNPPPAALSSVASLAAGEDFHMALVQSGAPQLPLPPARLSTGGGNQLFYQPLIQGAVPMTYQWLHNGAAVAGQTNRFLLVPINSQNLLGNYILVVSNQFGWTSNIVVNFATFPNPAAYSAVGAWGDDLSSQCDVPPGIVNPIAAAAGAYHNIVMQRDGTVIAWGKNLDGQTNVPTAATNLFHPGGITNIAMVAAGGDHCLVLRNDRTVIAWGRNTDGQTNVPASASNVVAIAAGWAHCLALRSNGTVVAWGNGSADQTNVPANLTDVIAIAAGYYHNLALRSDGSLVAWGSQYLVPPGITNVVAIAAGREYSLALTADGHVLAWGDNSFGQCSVPASVTNAIAIKAGYGHSLAELADGTLVAWGRTNYGVTTIPAGLANAATIACGEDHELAIVAYGPPQVRPVLWPVFIHTGANVLFKADVSGTYPLTCQWLRNSFHPPGATSPWLIVTNFQYSDIALYALNVTNAIASVTVGISGINSVSVTNPSPYFVTPLPVQRNVLVGTPLCLAINGQGLGPVTYQAQLNGAPLTDDSRISGSASPDICFNSTIFGDGGSLTMVLTNNSGSYTGLVATVAVTPVVGWGDNSLGQLSVPPVATNVISLACGVDHSLALLANGTVTAWGNNTVVVDGVYYPYSVPASATQLVAIADGNGHSVGLKANGSVVVWGYGGNGETNVPASATNVIAIAAGPAYSQALRADGTIVAWGGGGGSLPAAFTNIMLLSTRGYHTVALRADGTLLEVGGSGVTPPLCTNVIAVCAGTPDSLVLQADGSLIAWGRNRYGQTNLPPAATDIVAIAAGDDHFIALRADGVAISWGSTNYTQSLVPAGIPSLGLVAAGSIHSLAVLGQPAQRNANAGDSVTFSAAQYGNRLATYQWQFNGTNIDGATNATLILTGVTWANSGAYRAIISNQVGSLISPVMALTVPPGSLVFDPSSLSYSPTNGAFDLRLYGAAGVYPIVLYSSTNLVDWTPVATNPPTTNTIEFLDVPPDISSQNFYRAVEQP